MSCLRLMAVNKNGSMDKKLEKEGIQRVAREHINPLPGSDNVTLRNREASAETSNRDLTGSTKKQLDFLSQLLFQEDRVEATCDKVELVTNTDGQGMIALRKKETTICHYSTALRE